MPLVVGDCVRVQNQTGPHPLKWDKTGIIIEVRQFDQYVVKVDGSGRVTLRNKKFLRKYIPALTPPPRLTIDGDIGVQRPMVWQNIVHTTTPTSHKEAYGPSITSPMPPQHPTVNSCRVTPLHSSHLLHFLLNHPGSTEALLAAVGSLMMLQPHLWLGRRR